jgi:hypothetical protein
MDFTNLTLILAIQVDNLEDYLEVYRLGAKRRKVGDTLMNAVSSRSHGILTLTIDQVSWGWINHLGLIDKKIGGSIK